MQNFPGLTTAFKLTASALYFWREFGINVNEQTNNLMDNMIQYNGTVNTDNKSEVK